ncbi:MAG: hypothetical protein OXG38_01230 [Chloroflexi bacterium]|nr:hypothetical protein [Chloroflexota bacterium]
MSVRIITIVALTLVLLVSAPLAGYLYAQSTVSAEVRITAALQEDGRVAFGLQQRVGDEWGETILPQVNKFPYATTTVDQWRYSSPVTIEITMPSAENDPAVEGAPATKPPPVDSSTGAWVRLPESGAYGLWDDDRRGAILLGCGDGDPILVVVATDEYLLNDQGADGISVRYRMGESQWQTARWWSDEDFDLAGGLQSGLSPMDQSTAFATWLSFAYTQSTTFHFSTTDYYRDTYTGTFTLTGLHAVLAALPCFSVTG